MSKDKSSDQITSEPPASEQPPFRIGHGYDVHRFGEGDFIVLGGAKIPHHSGFIAHSDGDVLLHAICDAMIGAVGEGDIGKHFPDSDENYKNIDSLLLLEQSNKLISKHKYTIANIDCTVIAQSPKMAPHIDVMRNNIADVLTLSPAQVNIKATTTETLGFAGREEGIAAHAVVMLYRISD